VNRIEAAKKFDLAIAEATDNITGLGRVRAALPPAVFGKLFPTTPLGKQRSLGQSEADLWNLPDQTISMAA
jgi:hypothetical protein